MSDDGEVVQFPGGKRGYTITHPPFESGNLVSLRHGAYSDRVVSPIASHLVEGQLEVARADGSPSAYLLDETYRPALQAWAEAETRAELYAGQLAAHECEGCKACSGWDEKMRRWQVTAMNHRARLGLDPLSRARLGRDKAATGADVTRVFEMLRRLEAAGVEIEPGVVPS